MVNWRGAVGAVNKGSRVNSTKELASSYLVTSSAAFAALFVFIPIGQRVFAAGFNPSANSVVDTQLTVAFLLNIAVILFAWRRSKDLQEALSANQLAQQSAHDNAFSDHVTGLANRRELMRVLAEADLSSKQRKLVLLDLDFFKKINDLHGHIVGDEVLRRVAEILKREAPASSCCARLGGDEFAVLVPAQEDEFVNQSVSNILCAISEPLVLDTVTVHVSASVGVSIIEQGMNAEECLRRSDIAMYAAKRAGRNRQVWFDKPMERDVLARTQLEEEIRDAVAASEFVPYYQPQVDLETGQLSGFEVLARWHSPTRGVLEPTEFMDVAEASGLISELSLSVMSQAFREAREWPGHLKIAVNISPIQFKDLQLAERVLKILAESNFPASRLEIEITESSFLEDQGSALTIVQSLKNMGATISLDDFGTGYASLSQLQSLPFDRIKIDKSFVASLLSDPQSDAIVNSILSLGRALGLPITAEGIENDGTRDRLCMLGCSAGQGWLFGKAVSGAEVSATFKSAETVEGVKRLESSADLIDERGGQRRRAAGGHR